MNFVRSLKNKTISKKHYNFRLASPEVKKKKKKNKKKKKKKKKIKKKKKK